MLDNKVEIALSTGKLIELTKTENDELKAYYNSNYDYDEVTTFTDTSGTSIKWI